MATLGLFSVTAGTDIALDQVPKKLHRFFRFTDLAHADTDRAFAFGQPFAVRFEAIDGLPNGYVKHFVPSIKRDDFVRAMNMLFGHGRQSTATYPPAGETGFLGARHFGDLTETQLANQARRRCQGTCRTTRCRQTGCVCNRALGRCV